MTVIVPLLSWRTFSLSCVGGIAGQCETLLAVTGNRLRQKLSVTDPGNLCWRGREKAC